MKAHGKRARVDTTLGELIEAASEAAFEHCQDTKEAYALTSLVLVEMLKRRFSVDERKLAAYEEGAGVGEILH